jgi:hypothetical protein
VTHSAFAIADDDNRGKSKPAATFDHLSDTIDAYQPFKQIAIFARVAPSPSCRSLCHIQISLKVQAALAGRLGKGFDTPVKNVTPAVKNHVTNACRLRTFRDKFSNLRSGSNIRTFGTFEGLILGRCVGNGVASDIVDDLHIDMPAGPKHGKAWTKFRNFA